MSWIAVGVGAVTLAGSLMQESDQNDAMAQKASEFGTRKAGIEAFQKRQGELLSDNIQQLIENTVFAEQEIDFDQSQAEAQARVNAAQAGVGGVSVEQNINETEVNAERAKKNVERQSERDVKQTKANFVEKQLQADNEIGTLDTATRDQGTKHALSFASGFLGGL